MKNKIVALLALLPVLIIGACGGGNIETEAQKKEKAVAAVEENASKLMDNLDKLNDFLSPEDISDEDTDGPDDEIFPEGGADEILPEDGEAPRKPRRPANNEFQKISDGISRATKVAKEKGTASDNQNMSQLLSLVSDISSEIPGIFEQVTKAAAQLNLQEEIAGVKANFISMFKEIADLEKGRFLEFMDEEYRNERIFGNDSMQRIMAKLTVKLGPKLNEIAERVKRESRGEVQIEFSQVDILGMWLEDVLGEKMESLMPKFEPYESLKDVNFSEGFMSGLAEEFPQIAEKMAAKMAAEMAKEQQAKRRDAW